MTFKGPFQPKPFYDSMSQSNKDRDCTASLGDLFQLWTELMEKKGFPYLQAEDLFYHHGGEPGSVFSITFL